MVENTLNDKNSYELMQNDNGDIMIMLYANESKPLNPSFHLNETIMQLELIRNSKNSILIEELQAETIEKIKKLQTIYVCEIKYNEENSNNDDAEIVYAYAARYKAQEPTSPRIKKEKTLQEKLEQTREKIIEKRNKENSNSDQ